MRWSKDNAATYRLVASRSPSTRRDCALLRLLPNAPAPPAAGAAAGYSGCWPRCPRPARAAAPTAA
ncbi:MAG: hypothetical protein ACRYFX_26630 [Janthinobacterium lividum]